PPLTVTRPLSLHDALPILPITRLQIGAYLAVAACWAAVLTWKWPLIQAWANSLTPSHVVLASAGAQAAATASLSVSFFAGIVVRSEEHTSELQSLAYLVCR